MVMPAAEMGLARLRSMARQTMTGRVRLYSLTERHDPGARPVKTWMPDAQDRAGKLIAAKEGGVNIRADQPSVAGDSVLVMEPGAPLVPGMRATVEWVDSRQEPQRRAVAINRVLPQTPNEITRRALVVEVNWWPEET